MTSHVREAFAWYTPSEAASLTRRSVATIRAQIQSGELKASQPGKRNYLIRADWLDAWMNQLPAA